MKISEMNALYKHGNPIVHSTDDGVDYVEFLYTTEDAFFDACEVLAENHSGTPVAFAEGACSMLYTVRGMPDESIMLSFSTQEEPKE